MATNDKARKRATALTLAACIAAPCEGLRQVAYRDPVGIPTVCFGMTKGVKMGDTHTVEECKVMLTDEMMATVDKVDRCHPGLPVEVLAAASDAAYNLGPGIVCNRGHTLSEALYSRQYLQACESFKLYNTAKVAGIQITLPGLTTRRALERDLCLKGIA